MRKKYIKPTAYGLKIKVSSMMCGSAMPERHHHHHHGNPWGHSSYDEYDPWDRHRQSLENQDNFSKREDNEHCY